MSDFCFQLQEQLLPMLRACDLARCKRTVTKTLSELPRTPFHIALELTITNEPEGVALYFDEFFRQQPRALVAAAYAEMNGFTINPDLWFCSAFAYQHYGGHDDYDWLSNWQSSEYDDLAITGLEALQQVYASSAFRDKRYADASSVASLLVLIQFQQLIENAARHMEEFRFPLLASAHDWDFIYEIRPENHS